MSRKSLLSLLLSLLLVMAQMGAVVHELGHYSSSDRAGAQGWRAPQEQKQAPGAPCEKCVVYAHLAGAVAPDIPAFAQPLLAYDVLAERAVAPREAEVPTARSRGPPVVL